MKLRWFQTYDEFGVDSSVQLQYWDEENERWETVPYLRVSEKKAEECMIDFFST